MRGRGVESAEGTLFWTVQLNLSVSAGIMTLSLCFHMEQDIIFISYVVCKEDFNAEKAFACRN